MDSFETEAKEFFSDVYRTITEAQETRDDFIFTHISNFLGAEYQTIIPKKLLIFALDEFRHNHPDIYESMISDAQHRATYEKERRE